MAIPFLSKAETLESLRPVLSKAMVLPQFRFTVEQWNENKQQIKNFKTLPDWFKQTVIVRSSGLSEDSATESLAGHFVSVANVNGTKEIDKAIEMVVSSFEDDNKDHQVFVQPMLENVKASGVAFTRDPSNGGHYYIINYDNESGQTDKVTDGSSNELCTFVCVKSITPKLTGLKKKLIGLLQELESLFKKDALDVEFALTQNDELVLLQVRPLILTVQSALDLEGQKKKINQIHSRVSQLIQQHPYLYGDKTVFGVMPDWNPAEIIGIRPRPLALSFYKELVTDSIWAYQRQNYGYRNLRSFPLLVSFYGLPYIDVRVSFNSFIPSDIPEGIARKLVNHYITQLENNPSHHDKVEFEIIYSCYTLDLPQRLKKLKEHGFNDEDCTVLQESLRNLTNTIIHGDEGLWKVDRSKLSSLDNRFSKILSSDLTKSDKIYWLIEDCKRYGTLPFAGLARAGFIAVSMLKSMITTGVITEEEYSKFMNSLDTVSSNLSDDLNQLDRESFLKKYGHLRPGTYDILSPRYDEEPERYFDWNNQNKMTSGSHRENFSVSLQSLNKLESLLKEHGLKPDPIGFLNFIKGAIEGREYAKFVFTKSLSEVLSLVKEIGQDFKISTDDLSYVNIQIFKELYSSGGDIETALKRSIEHGKENYQITKCLNLPPLICNEQDVIHFDLPKNEPNFITLKSQAGTVTDENTPKESLKDSILMIPSADPGYDWIFSHKIGGFITMYGGVNSHMAIRAGELGVPAVIGAGESFYNQWQKAKMLEIDCAQKQVRVLQ